MRINLRPLALLCASLTVAAVVGCSQKTDANAELEKAASTMANPEPASSPAPATAATPAQPAQATEPAPAPAQQMSQAMVAYKAGNLEDAVTRLQELRATPVMTPQQRMALNDAMAAVMADTLGWSADWAEQEVSAVTARAGSHHGVTFATAPTSTVLAG